MQEVLPHIAEVRKKFGEHPFFADLAAETRPECAGYALSRFAIWVFNFQDFLRLNEAAVRDPELRKTAIHHRKEDDGHQFWFCSDLDAFDIEEPGLRELFEAENNVVRDAATAIMAEVFRTESDVVRIMLILALEAHGHEFFGQSHELVRKLFPNEELKYFSKSHLDVEKAHEFAEKKKLDELVANNPLDDAARAAATAAIDRVHASFMKMLDGVRQAMHGARTDAWAKKRHDANVTRVQFLSASFMHAKAAWLFAENGLADILRAGPRSVAYLANVASLAYEPLQSMLRVLAMEKLLKEVRTDVFRLTAAGALLCNVPHSMRAWVLMNGGPVQKAFEEAGHALETGDPAFSRVHGTSFSQYLGAHPREATVFAGAMESFGALASDALLECGDFSGSRHVVEIGAGPGKVTADLLEKYPNLHVTTFDLPHVVERIRESLQRKYVSESRCRIVDGDFFKSVPVGGDVYVLTAILHSWNDDELTRILRNCREAIAGGGRLMLVEIVIPPGNDRHFGKTMDFMMKTAFGGKERTAAAFKSLLADAGFTLKKVNRATSIMSVLSAEAA